MKKVENGALCSAHGKVRSTREWKVILKWILKRCGGMLWAECICLRIGKNGRLS
jgi:hypothetical protein